MRRFIVERNIERFERALRGESDPIERTVIASLLAKARQELAELDQDEAVNRPPPARRQEK